MMAKRALRLLLAALLLTLAGESSAQEAQLEGGLPGMLMPRVGVQIQAGGFALRGEEFSSAFGYRLLIDIWQYKRHILYTEIDAETSLGLPGEDLAFNRIRHQVAILGYRYDLGDYYVGLSFYHRCHNPFKERGRLETNLERNITSTYSIGLDFKDKAMMVGMKDWGLAFDPHRPFEFLGRWHFALSLYRVLGRFSVDLDWIFTGKVRYDLFRYRFLVPYLEAGGEVLGWSKWQATPQVEAGIRFHGGRLEFTPFCQWGHSQEWARHSNGGHKSRFVAHSYVFAGGRLEFLLDQETLAASPSGKGLQLFPEVHGSAEYAFYLGSRYNSSLGNVELNLDLLRVKPLTLFANLRVNLDAPKEDLTPGKVLYWPEYGLRFDWDRCFLEAFVCNAKRLDVYDFNNVRESANLAGGRFGTQGMRLGHYDDGISFQGPALFQWLHHLNGEVSLAHYFHNQDWPFRWNLAAQARWDVLRWHFVIPYLAGGVEWLTAGRGSQDAVEGYVEPGLRFHGILDVALYLRLQHRETIRSSRGPAENQSLIGIRALF